MQIDYLIKSCMLVISTLFVAWLGMYLSASSQLTVRPFIVVGASAAGTAVIKTLEKENYSGPVIWITGQLEKPYKMTKIDSIIDKSITPEEISIFDEKSSLSLQIIPEKRVVKVLPESNSLILDDGTELLYEKLFLGTGVAYQLPEEFNKPIAGVFTFGTLTDATRIQDYIAQNGVKEAVIVGAGINGMELGSVLVSIGVKVTMIERNEWILHKLANDEASRFIKERAEKVGVCFHMQKSLTHIDESHGVVSGAILSDGMHVPCQMIIFTTGGKINSEFLKDSGIALGRSSSGDAICVDRFMQTNKKSIYAAGDAVLIKDIISGNLRRSIKWADAKKQGVVAAHNMLGKLDEYEGSSFVVHSKFFGMRFASCGAVTLSYDEYKKKMYRVRQNREIPGDEEEYWFIVFDKEVLKGFVLAGSYKPEDFARLKHFAETALPMTKETYDAYKPE